ncbi:MAG: hypothetical protein ACXV5L_09205, partial [Thermoanaerobaculia bacterium]
MRESVALLFALIWSAAAMPPLYAAESGGTATALQNVETLTTDDDHYDKYPSIAFDRDGTMWIAYTSMHDDHDAIVIRSKRNGSWSAEERIDRGEGFEANPKLLIDRGGALWVFWHGRRNG